MGRLNDPFSMKFILPEHNQLLLDYAYEKTLVPKPTLEDDEMQEIGYLLAGSMENQTVVTIQWFEPIRKGLGSFRFSSGIVKRVDRNAQQIRLEDGDEVTWVKMQSIVSVREGYHTE